MTNVIGMLLIAAMLSPAAASAQDWLQWRGPHGTGAATQARPPVTWSKQGHNIRWKTPIPGAGHSSPVIWADRIFVTTHGCTDKAHRERRSTAPPAAQHPTLGGPRVSGQCTTWYASFSASLPAWAPDALLHCQTITRSRIRLHHVLSSNSIWTTQNSQLTTRVEPHERA